MRERAAPGRPGRPRSFLVRSLNADDDRVPIGILDVDDGSERAGGNRLANALALVAADARHEAEGGVDEADRDAKVHHLAPVLGDADAKLAPAARSAPLDTGANVLDPLVCAIDRAVSSGDMPADAVLHAVAAGGPLGACQRGDDRRGLLRGDR